MPDWLIGAVALLVSFGFAAAVAFGRRRQPCAVDPRIRESGRQGEGLGIRD